MRLSESLTNPGLQAIRNTEPQSLSGDTIPLVEPGKQPIPFAESAQPQPAQQPIPVVPEERPETYPVAPPRQTDTSLPVEREPGQYDPIPLADETRPPPPGGGNGDNPPAGGMGIPLEKLPEDHPIPLTDPNVMGDRQVEPMRPKPVIAPYPMEGASTSFKPVTRQDVSQQVRGMTDAQVAQELDRRGVRGGTTEWNRNALEDENPTFQPAPTSDTGVVQRHKYEVGRIDKDVARAIGKGEGGIRLEPGSIAHMETPERLRQLKKVGFESAGDAVNYVASGYNRIYRGRKDSLILVRQNGRDIGSYIELIPDKAEPYYRVNTVLPLRADFLKNKPLLWERAQSSQTLASPPSAVTGQSKGSPDTTPQPPLVKEQLAGPKPIWQMSLRESWNSGNKIGDTGPREMPQYEAVNASMHQRDWINAVQNALLEGKPVPEPVVREMMSLGDFKFPESRRADYPDIAAKQRPPKTPTLSTGTKPAGGGTDLYGNPTFEAKAGEQEAFGFKQDDDAARRERNKTYSPEIVRKEIPPSSISKTDQRIANQYDPKATPEMFGEGEVLPARKNPPERQLPPRLGMESAESTDFSFNDLSFDELKKFANKLGVTGERRFDITEKLHDIEQSRGEPFTVEDVYGASNDTTGTMYSVGPKEGDKKTSDTQEQLRRIAQERPRTGPPVMLGAVSKTHADILRQLGVPVPEGTPHEAQVEAIRHVLDGHPELTADDIAKLPDVVQNPNWIGATKNKDGTKRIWLLKQNGRDQLYLAIYGENKGKLRLKTYYTEETGKILRDLKSKGVPLESVATSDVISGKNPGYPGSQPGLVGSNETPSSNTIGPSTPPVKENPPDIRYSVAPAGPMDIPASPAKPAEAKPGIKDRIRDVLDSDFVQAARRKLEDEFLSIRRVVAAIKKEGGIVDDANNTDAKLDTYHGKVANQYRDVERTTIQPIIDTMSRANLSQKQVDRYLTALHAPERNLTIAERNPGNPGMADGGSGMKTADANRIVSEVQNSGLRSSYEKIAQLVGDMNRRSLELMHDSGLISDEDYARLQKWKNYVPLRHEMEGERSIRPGRGFDIRGREYRSATGRTTEADSPLAFSIIQAQERIVRAEKNAVAQSMAKLIGDNPNAGLWEIDAKPPTVRDTDPKTGMVVERMDPRYKLADNVVAYKDAGKIHLMVFHGEEGGRIATAMKRLNANQTNAAIRLLQKPMSVYKSLQTTYNPDFLLPNLTRDIQEAGINLSAEQDKGMAGRMARGVPKSIKAMWPQVPAIRLKRG